MSDHTEGGRLDQRTAERLLDGDRPLDGAGGQEPLHALLASAAAPGRPGELAGEDAAAAAFLAAPAPARTSRLTVLHRFLTAKAIALVGGSILLTGGVAYATGHFPGQEPSPAPSPTHDRRGGGHDSTPATRYSPSPLPPRPSPHPSASPSPSSTAAKRNGESAAPNQQKSKSSNSHSTSAPPRGPGDDNGNNTPTANPGKGKGRNTNQGTPAGENSGNGVTGGLKDGTTKYGTAEGVGGS
ncbi:hypothetical protein [Actinomadura sp. GTD37]|uniref:hypothetical protein n=1 Tax=Actinomadura sp. GTD37 TaxID=1778030 RepID=UPI0035BF58B0